MAEQGGCTAGSSALVPEHFSGFPFQPGGLGRRGWRRAPRRLGKRRHWILFRCPLCFAGRDCGKGSESLADEYVIQACLQERDRLISSPPVSAVPTAVELRHTGTTLLVSELAAFPLLLGEKGMGTRGGAEAQRNIFAKALQRHP